MVRDGGSRWLVVVRDSGSGGDNRFAAHTDQGFEPPIDLEAPGGEGALWDIIELDIMISQA